MPPAFNAVVHSYLPPAPQGDFSRARLQREVQQYEADLAVLYRSTMSLEARQRERALRAQLKDASLELQVGGL
jgi:hypothetical protein